MYEHRFDNELIDRLIGKPKQTARENKAVLSFLFLRFFIGYSADLAETVIVEKFGYDGHSSGCSIGGILVEHNSACTETLGVFDVIVQLHHIVKCCTDGCEGFLQKFKASSCPISNILLLKAASAEGKENMISCNNAGRIGFVAEMVGRGFIILVLFISL